MKLTAEQWVASLGWSWARQERIDALAREIIANKNTSDIWEAFDMAERFEIMSAGGFAKAAEEDAKRKVEK